MGFKIARTAQDLCILCMNMYVFVFVGWKGVSNFMCVYTCVCLNVCICVYVCVYVHICV